MNLYPNPFCRSYQFGLRNVDAHHVSSGSGVLIRDADSEVVEIVGADVYVDCGPNTL